MRMARAAWSYLPFPQLVLDLELSSLFFWKAAARAERSGSFVVGGVVRGAAGKPGSDGVTPPNAGLVPLGKICYRIRANRLVPRGHCQGVGIKRVKRDA